MNKVAGFFSTDWGAMTANDYFGAAFAIVMALVMVGAYWYAFSPKNREKFVGYGKIPLNEGRRDGRKEE